MGQRFHLISDEHRAFIQAQRMFFVGTACGEGRVNVSPKGMDSLRVVDANRVLWLNLTGSGNETSAHLQRDPRMTIMFCAFSGPPLILRLYGQARVIHPGDAEWSSLINQFPELPGARQICDVNVDLVQSSCGMAVPLYTYETDRSQLNDWARRQGPDGLRRYWQQKNQTSLDGFPTGMPPVSPPQSHGDERGTG